MVKMFGCPRSRNAHIERKKSKCDYMLDSEPDAEQVAMVEAKVNDRVLFEVVVNRARQETMRKGYNPLLGGV